MRRVLIAGIGNVFFGDDGFGCEVARRLALAELPEGVEVRDFGIRSMDLAFALLAGYGAVVLIDAVRRGGAPGTLYVIEPELGAIEAVPAGPHDLTVASVLALARRMGEITGCVLLVGCEGAEWGDEEAPEIALSPAVRAAVAPAAELALGLVAELLQAPRSAHA